MKTIQYLCSALFLMLVTACAGPSFTIDTPAGFVEIKNEFDSYDYRATSADGMVIAVREIEHDPQGEAEFWLQAIKNRMRDRGGYALLDTLPVKSGDGLAGTQLRFGHDHEGDTPHLYYISLFVSPSALYLVETGGTKDQVTGQDAKLDAALRSFRRK